MFLYSNSTLDLSNGRGLYAAGGSTTNPVNYGQGFTVEGTEYEQPYQLKRDSDDYYRNLLVGDEFTTLSPIKADFEKVPRFYLFGADKSQRGFVPAKVEFGETGSFPGYIVAPCANIESGVATNSHRYLDGTAITGDSYPNVFGMLMCNYATFPSAASTYVKYDPRMVDPDTKGLTGDELTAAQEIYNAIHEQFANDVAGVLIYNNTDDPTDDDADGDATPAGTVVWTVTL
jgi:hypothetical protein